MRRVLALVLALRVHAALPAPGARPETGRTPRRPAEAAPGFPSLEEKCGKPPPSELGCKKLILGDSEAALHERETCIADAGAHKSCFDGWHTENEARLTDHVAQLRDLLDHARCRQDGDDILGRVRLPA